MPRIALAALAALLLLAAPAHAAKTIAPQPPLDITKLPYNPIGFFKPGDPIPATSAPPKPDGNGLFNPSGHFSAYDTNVYESLNFPTRQADDQSNKDPLGNGGNPYGFCPQGGAAEGGSDPQFIGAGRCYNHQLEYLDHFERTMKAILGDFGVVVKRYEFQSPGSTNNAGTRSAAGNNGAGTSTAPGRSFNISAEVPGADNPEETVLVSGHYDFTDSGPAAAWDSSEGHAEVIRMAKIMADYWRATGTRPSATVKFIPWDQEETGTVGSKDYVANNIPPGEEDEIRGYFNVDPCAGAYPAYYHGDGNEGSRVNMTLQLADPAGQKGADATEFASFNKRAETIVDEVFEHVDDTLDTPAGKKDLFVTPREAQAENKVADRDHVVTALGGLLLFGSDYSNFEAIGVPFFNLSPDMFGPHADPTTDSPTTSNEGVAILHTPQDNLQTLNRLTGPDQTGLTASEGWMKGMEICSQLESWYMLQPNMGGAQTASSDPVAYYTALPNEAIVDQGVTFDGSGSYQYAATGTRQLVPDANLEYRWDFGDGTTATGRTVKPPTPSRASSRAR
jgi:Zn-dependent M28 family amino/carboxypeptidase